MMISCRDYLDLSCLNTSDEIVVSKMKWKVLLLQACDWLWPLQESQLLPNQVLSEQQSSVVIRKLLAIAVSGITYLRGLFPEKAYGNKYVEGYMTHTSSLTSWCLNGPGIVSSHRSESDDPQGGRQLSWDNSACSVVNNSFKPAATYCLLGGALAVRLTKINVWYDDRNGRKNTFSFMHVLFNSSRLQGCFEAIQLKYVSQQSLIHPVRIFDQISSNIFRKI